MDKDLVKKKTTFDSKKLYSDVEIKDKEKVGVLIDMHEFKMYMFIDGIPIEDYTTYFRENDVYYPAFCVFGGKIELTNCLPKRLPKDLQFLMKWNYHNHHLYPLEKKLVVETMMLIRRVWKVERDLFIPKNLIFMIFEFWSLIK